MSARRQTAHPGRAFEVVRAWLENGPAAGGRLPHTEADVIAERFGLDDFSRNVLLLCAYASLEPQAQETISRLLGSPSATAPTVGVALARLPGANWQALAADGGLRRARLIGLEGNGGVTAQRLVLPEPVLFRLLGAPSLGETSARFLRPLETPAGLAPNRQRFAGEIKLRLSIPGDPILHLIGTDPDGKLQAYAQAAGPAYAMNAQLLPGNMAELIQLCGEVYRDLTLIGGRLALVHDPMADERLVQIFEETYPGPLAIVSADPLRTGHRRAIRLEMPALTAAEQHPVWENALGKLGRRMNGTMPKIAATFRVPPETAEAIAAELHAVTAGKRAPRKKGGDDFVADAAWDACRRAARPRMDDLAQRIDSTADWDDLILPERQKEVLSTIVAQVRNRVRVYEEWDFATRLHNRGLGVSAIFSGPSGSGKTLAGEVLGARLKLDVYRVDLSALVSKWVGETEKNLRRVFDAAEDGGVILQFDEADALFGRRSEVKDSHDRHANIEVSYLLQRLEAYRGLCILTTNMRDNIDEAFLRRIRFSIEFRFPGRDERRAIWERIFPTAVPRDKLDLDRLAQFNIAGGSIRNIALSAGFLAADRAGRVGMADIFAAARQEYEKLGRGMTDVEKAGWAQ